MTGGIAAHLVLTLLVCAVAALALLLATFAVALRVGRYSVVDTVWGLGFAVVAAAAFLTSLGHGDDTRRLLLLAATVIWGVRLAVHIGLRSRGAGEDPRYADMLEKAPGSPRTYALRKVFLTQAGLVWLISIPVQAGMFARGRPGAVLLVGAVLWLIGLVFESVGDWQLSQFKKDRRNRGTIMDRGLWRYTRHPNYFGDACVWWGLFLMSCGSWWMLATIFSPLLMTFLLTAGSGKPITEGRMAGRPGYAEYIARTSGFFPLPPRRRPVS